ncbi:hypothetical protein [Polyangium aurulentum]|uniref:hypothetical protein n=1 Tax=Polyangium aurulentum TaxID=2567896 RepID=UPI001F2182C2|nr:hypothetical protein [Polyangium aurulentum]
MAALEPLIRGRLAAHPAAPAFAAEVLRIHRRYASEIVQTYGLCPFVRDVDVAFGRFAVMLDAELDLDAARDAVLAAKNPVVHVVFPCALPPPNVFERFASSLYKALQGKLETPPVMAAFHPQLAGDAGAAHRLVGLLRRAPDPFVQLIPEGMNESGTVFAHVVDEETLAAPPDRSELVFQRLQGEALERLLATAADIREDRDRSYAPHLAMLG